MFLFLDDERFANDVVWLDLPKVNWFIVRNYKEFVDYITNNGLPQIISFDHDLADSHYKEYVWANDEKNLNKGTFDYSKVKEKTGYDAAKWLAEYCLERDLDLPEYYIHSLNNIGKKNIQSILESYTKIRKIDKK